MKERRKEILADIQSFVGFDNVCHGFYYGAWFGWTASIAFRCMMILTMNTKALIVYDTKN